MQHKVVFTADTHGNEFQYRKLVDYAIKVSSDSIVIGGDIAPCEFGMKNRIKGQRHFLDKRLSKFLLPIKEKKPDLKMFLIMGNDDCAANLDILEKNDPNLFQIIHEKRIKLTEEFDIVGYSYVPITPFGLKDWEKYDLSEAPKNLLSHYELRKATNYDFSGYKSTRLGLEKFRFAPEMEKTDSIQKDLDRDLFCRDSDSMIYVFHSPPDDTNLDVTYYDEHVGSMAIRLFVEKHQPYLTLHGHIHETVERSGTYKQQIGKHSA